MRNEFNELVNTLKRWELYHENDEVDIALTDLENKIDEVMKRIDCAVRSNQDINSITMQLADGFQDDGLSQQTLSDVDFETLQRSVYDVDIALNLNDTECIDNNWYNLFEPTEELKPIAVNNIEYDFTEAVFSIGNADNTEFVADVYDSDFGKLLEFGVIIVEDAEDFIFGKANYIVKDNSFIPMVKLKEIDLSKVPIIREEFMSFESSWGYISCDKDGNVISIDGDEEINGERNYLFDIAKFDLVEYGKFCESQNIVMGEYGGEDILAVGFWKKDGTYEEADKDWRKGDDEDFDDEEDAPTQLCIDPTKHEIVNSIISQLKDIEVDCETMYYNLKQVGMDYQVLMQLFAQTTNDEIDYLHDVRNGKG
jgi:hypothetical protein